MRVNPLPPDDTGDIGGCASTGLPRCNGCRDEHQHQKTPAAAGHTGRYSSRSTSERSLRRGTALCLGSRGTGGDLFGVARLDQGQAWPEIARVVRPGGTFAVMWSGADRSVAWVGGVLARGDDRSSEVAGERPRRRLWHVELPAGTPFSLRARSRAPCPAPHERSATELPAIRSRPVPRPTLQPWRSWSVIDISPGLGLGQA